MPSYGTFDEADRRQLKDKGFVVLRGVVPINICEAIRTDIVSSLSQVASNDSLPPHWKEQILPESQFPASIQSAVEIIQPISNAVIGQKAVLHRGVQLTGHLPNEVGLPVHMDEQASGELFANLPKFDLLIGLIVTDLSRRYHANLKLFPEVHRRLAECFSDPDCPLKDNLAVTDKKFRKATARVAYGQPERILGTAGDLIVMSGMLPHEIDVNRGPFRPMPYFRPAAVNRIPDLQNPWRNCPAM